MDKSHSEHDREEKGGSIGPKQDTVSGYSNSATDAEALVQGLRHGQLTSSEQEALAGLLVEDDSPQYMTAIHRHQTTMYSGSLPHPEHFNAYDEDTRRTILQMVVDDQKHTHEMQMAGLTGAIEKDKRGQRYGLTIALGGFIAAASIAPFSPVVAGIIGALDIFGMVALFVAPRVLEFRADKPKEQPLQPRSDKE